MTGLRRLLRFDAGLLASRPLYRTVVVAGIGAAVLVTATTHHAGSGAWWRLAQAVRLLVPLELAFGAVLGAVSLAGDAASGALRGVLMRPVSRVAVVVSRSITLVAGLALGYVTAILTAAACGASLDSFGAITYGEGAATAELLGAGDVIREMPRLILLTIPGILCAPLIGIALSAVFDDAATAAVLALVAVLSPYLGGAFADAVPSWIFTHATVESTTAMLQLAEGVLTGIDATHASSFTLAATLTPAAWGVGAAVAAVAVFRARDFQS